MSGSPATNFDAARRAAGIAAAGVKLIDLRLVGQRQDQALALGNVKSADAFDCQIWHGCLIAVKTLRLAATRMRSACSTSPRIRFASRLTYQNVTRPSSLSSEPRVRTRMSRTAPTVRQVAMPNGLHKSHSGRMEILSALGGEVHDLLVVDPGGDAAGCHSNA